MSLTPHLMKLAKLKHGRQALLLVTQWGRRRKKFLALGAMNCVRVEVAINTSIAMANSHNAEVS
jgi:hypothetical protein